MIGECVRFDRSSDSIWIDEKSTVTNGRLEGEVVIENSQCTGNFKNTRIKNSTVKGVIDRCTINSSSILVDHANDCFIHGANIQKSGCSFMRCRIEDTSVIDKKTSTTHFYESGSYESLRLENGDILHSNQIIKASCGDLEVTSWPSEDGLMWHISQGFGDFTRLFHESEWDAEISEYFDGELYRSYLEKTRAHFKWVRENWVES